MSSKQTDFLKEAEIKAFDLNHRRTINFNISKYEAAVLKGKQQYKNLELARQRAARIKHSVINELEKYLVDFEANFESNGGKVIWAQDAKEANNEILKIAKKHQAKLVVKSKSMATEEIELNDVLERHKIESVETDLGEYIVQVAGEKPYHIITPAMHKSKEDIARLFHEKFNTAEDSTPEQLTKYVRRQLREKFVNADIGITGANFIIADTGAIGLTENEGNGLMSISFPKVHIVIVGIEKVIPSVKDFDLFWPLLATHGTGQNITVYNSIVTGPRQAGEADGPDEMYVILLDNGRTELLAREEQRKAMSCIRCGACLNVCPVYKNIGGYTYGTVYSGPIGSVITPHLKVMKEFKHLSFASSLCGRCAETCPVKVNLHELLLQNRYDSVKRGYYTKAEKFTMLGWKKVMLNRWMMNMAGAKTKNTMLKVFFRKAWGPRRTLPYVAPKSFNQRWKEQEGIGIK